MKNKIVSLILIGAVILASITGTKAAEEISFPGNLKVPILFQNYVSSEELKKGDKIQFVVADNVYVSNTLFFKKDSKGFVTIEKVRKNGILGRGGLIKITSGEVYDVYGNKHEISLAEKVKGEGKPSAVLLPLAAVGASFILFPYAAILTLGGSVAPLIGATLATVPPTLSAFRKGDNAKLPQAKIIYATHLSPKKIKIGSWFDLKYSK